MNSKLKKEYKQKFCELRTIINSWDLIPDSPSDEFDSINHLFLSLLYKRADEFKISKAVQFELTNNYGFSKAHIDSKGMTEEVLKWWNNSTK